MPYRKLYTDHLEESSGRVDEIISNLISRSNISITTDMWKSQAKLNFIVSTIHLQDDEENPITITGWLKILKDGKCETISNSIIEMKNYFNKEKIEGCSCDNGRNVCKAIKDLKIPIFNCKCHKCNVLFLL